MNGNGMKFTAEHSARSALPVVFPGEELSAYYQPIVSLPSGEIAGYESLGRSRDKSGSLRSIGVFLHDPAVNEAHKLRVDRALRYQALEYFAEHPEAGYLALNISPYWIENLGDNPAIPTISMIEETGIDPGRVVIEITETRGNIGSLKRMVDHYHAAGIRIAIDDFGTGSSQIDRIEALEPDIVKLDMRLFKQAVTGGISADVALSVMNITNRIGCHIICEGVESEEEVHFGIECGCSFMQGYFFHPAMPEPIARESTITQVRGIQQRYLRKKSDKLMQAARHKELLQDIILEIKQHFNDNNVVTVNRKMQDSGVFRYYVCDINGNQLTPNYEIRAESVIVNAEPAGLNWSHRPYFPQFVALRASISRNFFASTVYRDVATHCLCKTYGTYLDENRLLLVDAFVEDDILYTD